MTPAPVTPALDAAAIAERKTITIYAKPTREEIIRWAESALRNAPDGDVTGALMQDLIADFADALPALLAAAKPAPDVGEADADSGIPLADIVTIDGASYVSVADYTIERASRISNGSRLRAALASTVPATATERGMREAMIAAGMQEALNGKPAPGRYPVEKLRNNVTRHLDAMLAAQAPFVAAQIAAATATARREASFPRCSGKGGWTIDPAYLEQVQAEVETYGWDAQWEAIEAILLHAERALIPAPQPAGETAEGAR